MSSPSTNNNNNNNTPSTPSAAQTTTTTTTPPLAQTPRDIESYRRLFYTTSLGLCVFIPIIVLLPPRKLDLYTLGLGVTWCMSAGFVSEQSTGRGLLWHVGSQLPSVGNRERERERLEREAMRERREEGEGFGIGSGNGVGLGVREEVKRRGLLKRIWMGGESDDWVEERKRKEREALEEGRGYGGLIMDQIKEVWGVKKEDEEDDEDHGHRDGEERREGKGAGKGES